MFIKGFKALSIAMTIASAIAMIQNSLMRYSKQQLFSSSVRRSSSLSSSESIPSSPSSSSSSRNGPEASKKSPEYSKNILDSFFPLAAYPEIIDTQVIEQRQISRTAIGLFGVENVRCKYGFPQAYVQYPVGGGVSSGMLRLSCPHLVKAVDELEKEGALDDFDGKLADEEEGRVLRASFSDTNEAWRSIRKEAVTEQDRQTMNDRLGREGAKHLMESGIIGCTIGKLQVKCLHAHIADHLLRGSNEIGAEALERLKEKGVDVKGCDSCWQQCDTSHAPTSTSWWYTSVKNKQKLASARIKRYQQKALRAKKESFEEKNEEANSEIGSNSTVISSKNLKDET